MFFAAPSSPPRSADAAATTRRARARHLRSSTARRRYTVAAGGKYQYIPSASAPDGRALSFDISNKPEWAAFAVSTGELSGTPQASDEGLTAEIEIGVSDGTNRATVGPFRISVTAAAEHRDRPPAMKPSIAGSPATKVTAGQAYRFMPVVPAARHTEWSFVIVNRPAWARFNTATGELSGTPSLDSTGTFAHILISVSNGRESASLPAFAIHVLPAANDAPTISGAPPVTVVAGTAYAFTPVATDPQGRALTFAVANAPPWASFNTATGELSGTPPTADAGRYANILISATDGILSAALPAFAIEVKAPANDTPTISGTPAASVTAGSAYGFTPSTTDPAGAALVFSIQGMPAWANFSSATGRLSGTPRRPRSAPTQASSSASATAMTASRCRRSRSGLTRCRIMRRASAARRARASLPATAICLPRRERSGR